MTEINLDDKDETEIVQLSPLDGMGTAPDPAWFEQPANELPFERYVLTTPLHLVAATESRTNQWTEWNGYTLANVYTTVEQEYDALRTRAALSDISPLVKYRISGKDAAIYLDRLLTQSVAGVAVNQVARAVLCAGDGCIVTEGLLFRLGETDFRLVVRSPHLDWMLDSAEDFEVGVEDVSGTIAAMSLCGPLAEAVLEAVGIEQANSLEKAQAVWVELGGMPVYVSRTGMMGGSEFELWADPDDAPIVWRRLLDAGRTFGLLPVGMAVRNVARLENGIALEGIDYQSGFSAPDLSTACSPFDLGQGDRVSLERSLFNGQKALTAIAKRGSRHAMKGIEVDASPGVRIEAIFVGDRKVGRVTSHAWSPRLQHHIALALIETDALGASSGFTVEVNEEGEGCKRLAVKLEKRPFLEFS
ncbi:MAG: hypothetical protein COA62_10980 [Rhodobiaceae bacterium]|nr:MAG: hypothetical protein COA62_10980 [Rhodobiaceae bacterium]